MDNVYDERRTNKMFEKIIDRVEIPESGGFFTYHKSFDYPEKGWRNDYAVRVINYVKRLTITWVRFVASKPMWLFYPVFLIVPWKFKIKILERWLREYCNTANFYLESYNHIYFKNLRYYSPLSLELRTGILTFLKNFGISETLSKEVSFIFASMIEYDTAYYFRLEDLFSETTAEKMLENPAKEISNLVRLLAERDSKRLTMIERFESFRRLLAFALLLPRIKRAFKEAIKSMRFEKLQYDEADRYHVRSKWGYNFFGLTPEEREKKWPPEQHLWMEVPYERFNDQQLDKMFNL